MVHPRHECIFLPVKDSEEKNQDDDSSQLYRTHFPDKTEYRPVSSINPPPKDIIPKDTASSLIQTENDPIHHLGPRTKTLFFPRTRTSPDSTTTSVSPAGTNISQHTGSDTSEKTGAESEERSQQQKKQHTPKNSAHSLTSERTCSVKLSCVIYLFFIV